MSKKKDESDVVAVSACLAGVLCRYDGKSQYNKKVQKLLKKKRVIIICPELLGGFSSVPRPACQIVGGDGKDVLDNKATVQGIDRKDYTKAFIKGAKKGLDILKALKIKNVLLKKKSPSCGFGKIYKGKDLVKGNGVFCALLIKNGIKVKSL